jgi:hypothetical protein
VQSRHDGPLWALVGTLEREQLEAWRRELAPQLSAEVFFAERVNAVETNVQRRPGGNISVTVWIVCRQATDSRLAYFRLQRAANHFYKRVDPA